MYFIAYENRPKEQTAGYVPEICNVITYQHPLVWIDQTSKSYRQYFVTYIHFWAEVDDSEALRCKGVHKDLEPPEGYEPNGQRGQALEKIGKAPWQN